MANQWLRLWHDMPTDPKWRTIARVSKQPITAVIAVYIHMLVNASNASERGRTENWNDEDIASALDLEDIQVTAIREAMQGRVLEDDRLTGWESRQPIREDGSSDRAKAWRDKQKAESERNRTQPNAEKRPDKDSDTDKEKILKPSASSEKISLSAAGVWENISAEQKNLWQRAYPALSLDAELTRAAAWIVSNPANKKSNYARFLNAWLSKAQDRAPTTNGGRNGKRYDPAQAAHDDLRRMRAAGMVDPIGDEIFGPLRSEVYFDDCINGKAERVD